MVGLNPAVVFEGRFVLVASTDFYYIQLVAEIGSEIQVVTEIGFSCYFDHGLDNDAVVVVASVVSVDLIIGKKDF